MTRAGELLREEIRREGPISFRRFMDVSLYHPDFGYYRTPRDPFGKAGDFYTAEQLQPVFGILIAARIRMLAEELGSPAGFQVIELGAGRQEMKPLLSEWPYIPVDVGTGELPESFTGVVFSNEFFDALPVEIAIVSNGELRERLVGCEGDAFCWTIGEPAREEVADYVRSYCREPEEGWIYEINLDALRWMERVAGAMQSGFVFSIDYGYTRRESIRFPEGTLMGYRRHTAREDVLAEPGERDITAHVNFSALEQYGAAVGLERVKYQSLAQTLLTAGERDQFAAAMSADKLQLKTLLFGMGETFRVLLQRKARK